MHVIDTHSGRLQLRSGGGLVMFIFGLPFAGAGATIIYTSLTGTDAIPLPVGLPFGLVFVAAGIALSLGRAGKDLDLRQGNLTCWWGLLLPCYRKTYALADFDVMVLSQEVRRSKNSTYTVYPLRLHSAGVRVNLDETRDYFASRRIGERIAKFLNLPLADSGLGQERRREPEMLQISLRQQLHDSGETVELPPPPSEMQTTIKYKQRSVMLQTPPSNWQVAAAIAAVVVVVGTIMTLIIGTMFLRSLELSGTVQMVLLLLAPLPNFAATWLIWRAMAPGSAERLIVDPEQSLQLYRVGRNGNARQLNQMPITEWEELVLCDATPDRRQGMLAISDKTSIHFGKNLGSDELNYLAAVIRKTLLQ